MINIKQLLKAFDHFIYAQINENHLPSSENKRTNNILLKDIYEYIQETPSTFDLPRTLEYYAATYYINNNNAVNIPLVYSYRIKQDKLIIVHNDYVLLHVRNGSPCIRNLYIYMVLSRSTLSNNALQYYSIIGKKEAHHKVEVLKRLFSQAGDNNRLKDRKLRPLETETKKLYDEGLLPFYIEIKPIRKVTFPPVFTSFEIKRYDYIQELYLGRQRPEFIKRIMDTLSVIYASNEIITYYLNAIGMLSDERIYELYALVDDIEKDPDYVDGKITLYSLLMVRIARQFKIVLPVEYRT